MSNRRYCCNCFDYESPLYPVQDYTGLFICEPCTCDSKVDIRPHTAQVVRTLRKSYRHFLTHWNAQGKRDVETIWDILHMALPSVRCARTRKVDGETKIVVTMLLDSCTWLADRKKLQKKHPLVHVAWEEGSLIRLM